MASYGYARVSTLDQDLTIHRAVLKAAGCTVVRAEKASGSRRDGRTELQVLLDFVQPGDTLVHLAGYDDSFPLEHEGRTLIARHIPKGFTSPARCTSLLRRVGGAARMRCDDGTRCNYSPSP